MVCYSQVTAQYTLPVFGSVNHSDRKIIQIFSFNKLYYKHLSDLLTWNMAFFYQYFTNIICTSPLLLTIDVKLLKQLLSSFTPTVEMLLFPFLLVTLRTTELQYV